MTSFRVVALLPLLVGALAGCSTLRHGAGPLPEGFTVRELAKADADAPFAVSRSGEFAAVRKGAVQVIDAAGIGREITPAAATALCFSPDGKMLAAALPTEKGSVLRLFDQQGKVTADTTVPGKITSIVWRSNSQLLATSLAVANPAAGAGLSSRLYSWDGSAPPVAVLLGNVPVLPAAGKTTEEMLVKTLSLAVSPYGDEVAYSYLQAPPFTTPYQKIAVRHLESGTEREVAKTSLGSGGPIFTPDGESLLVGDTHALTRRLSIPDGREMDAWPSPGSYPAVSTSGAYAFLDGRLYQNGRTVLSFPSEARGVFLPDGSGLAISYDGKIYLVSGLKDLAAPALPADMERLLKLRRLRSLGVISEKEYRKQKGRIR
jgi:WD40 repeat protein